MTLEAFRATRREVSDLREVFQDDSAFEVATAGYVYQYGPDATFTFYIEKTADGRVYLILERDEWLVDADQLPQLEVLLYEFAHAELSN
jgi:hypothetical protein